MELKMILPGHREIVNHPSKALNEAQKTLQFYERRFLKELQNGEKDIATLTGAIFYNIPSDPRLLLRRLGLVETYLQKLEKKHTLSSRPLEGTRYYLLQTSSF